MLERTRTDGRFVVYDNQTVLDTKTSLMWAAKDNGRALSWPDAKSLAMSSRAGGYTDWRLPTLDELKGLYDAATTYQSGCAEPIGDNGQPLQDAGEVHLSELVSLTCLRLWTSQGSDGYPGSVIMFDFHYGNDVLRPGFQSFIDTAVRVLPVRSEQAIPENVPIRRQTVISAADETLRVETGTVIPLSLLTSIDTQHAAAGDHLQFKTEFPIVIGRRIVVPQGSKVLGTITAVLRDPNRGYILGFNSLVLPNGVTRDIQGRQRDPGGLSFARGRKVVLPQGAKIEMTLDGALEFHRAELDRAPAEGTPKKAAAVANETVASEHAPVVGPQHNGKDAKVAGPSSNGIEQKKYFRASNGLVFPVGVQLDPTKAVEVQKYVFGGGHLWYLDSSNKVWLVTGFTPTERGQAVLLDNGQSVYPFDRQPASTGRGPTSNAAARSCGGRLEWRLVEDPLAVSAADSDAAARYIRSGDDKMAKSNARGALEDYDQALRLKPQLPDPYVYSSRAVAKGMIGDFDGSIADSTRAAELKPGFQAAYVNRGMAKEKQCDWEGSVSDFTRALELGVSQADKDKVTVFLATDYYFRSEWRSARQDFDGAIDDCNMAIRLVPNFAEAYSSRGSLRLATGDEEGAKADHNKALQLKPLLSRQ